MTRLEAWEQYGQRCREESAQLEAEYWAAWGKSPKTPPTQAAMDESAKRWEVAHAKSWAKLVADAEAG